jgi:hypothetical protein
MIANGKMFVAKVRSEIMARQMIIEAMSLVMELKFLSEEYRYSSIPPAPEEKNPAKRRESPDECKWKIFIAAPAITTIADRS